VNIPPSKVTLPDSFEHGQKAKGVIDVSQWWTLWKDPQLNSLVQQGIANNLDIELARTHLAEARATAQLASADKGPSIGLSGSVGGFGSNVDLPYIGKQDTTGYNAMGGLSASWEPDFFGKKQSDADAANYAALSKEEEIYATQVAVVSQIAQSYFNYNALWRQHDLLKKNIDVLEQLLRYMKGRFQAGQVTRYEVDEVETKISVLHSQQAALLAQAENYQRQIAVLLGKPPQAITLHPNTNVLTYAPAAPSGQLPSSVMERRPDVRAHALGIKARAAQVASAKADLLPRFDIKFLGQGGRIGFDSDLSGVNILAGVISAGVQLPIFTNGRIQANIDAADARLKSSVIEYDKTLLKALAEVESSYHLHDALSTRIQLLKKSASLQQKQAKDAFTLFQHGHKTLDNVLTAQLGTLDVQNQLDQAQLQRHENMIRLYQALGGGW